MISGSASAAAFDAVEISTPATLRWEGGLRTLDVSTTQTLVMLDGDRTVQGILVSNRLPSGDDYDLLCRGAASVQGDADAAGQE